MNFPGAGCFAHPPAPDQGGIPMSKRALTTDRKMAETLERISRVFHVLLWDTAKQIALSPLQIQIPQGGLCPFQSSYLLVRAARMAWRC